VGLGEAVAAAASPPARSPEQLRALGLSASALELERARERAGEGLLEWESWMVVGLGQAGRGGGMEEKEQQEEEQVSHLCACIGSPCLRHCGHGASIGGHNGHGEAACVAAGATGGAAAAAAVSPPADRARDGSRLRRGPEREGGGGGGGESFVHVHWVAVPKALRARRVNRRSQRPPPPHPRRLRMISRSSREGWTTEAAGRSTGPSWREAGASCRTTSVTQLS
jgi:hypothetical protein